MVEKTKPGRRFAKVQAIALILLSLTLFQSRNAFAWGDEGHQVVARIAEHFLNPAARGRILDLLKSDQRKDYYTRECPQAQTVADYMACVSPWADRVRNDRPETYNWHFVDIPNRTPNGRIGIYNEARDCKCMRDGDCIVRAIVQFEAILARREDKSDRDRQKRIEALKFLIHFLGDLHQPLHSSDNNDRGGNDVKVMWFGTEWANEARKFDWNLHSVWDSGIIDKIDSNGLSLSSRLISGVAANSVISIQRGTPTIWANSSHRLSAINVYDPKFLVKKATAPDGSVRVDLGQAYFDAEKGIVISQLTAGGLRLAKVLNDALGY
jgi:hypothetical protein